VRAAPLLRRGQEAGGDDRDVVARAPGRLAGEHPDAPRRGRRRAASGQPTRTRCRAPRARGTLRGAAAAAGDAGTPAAEPAGQFRLPRPRGVDTLAERPGGRSPAARLAAPDDRGRAVLLSAGLTGARAAPAGAVEHEYGAQSLVA